METIQVQSQDANTFTVLVGGEAGTNHTVTLGDLYWKKLAGPTETKEDLIKRSFVFLLERESKESILSKFELSLIGEYFPEYEKTI